MRRVGSMEVWCFKNLGELWALTDEPTGSTLPTELGPWTPHRAVELSSKAADEREAIELIRTHGFCCFSSVTGDEGQLG